MSADPMYQKLPEIFVLAVPLGGAADYSFRLLRRVVKQRFVTMSP